MMNILVGNRVKYGILQELFLNSLVLVVCKAEPANTAIVWQ